jgi:RimJ/RimL family protein N-acetyltransferase
MQQVILRPATVADAANLLHWRNDSETRRWSRQGSQTSQAEHARWLGDSLVNVSRRLWIAEIDGTAVGTVRADWTADGIELSWTVAPERRGQGVATAMVRLARQSLPGRVYAYVKVGNQASVRIAISAGLQFESAHDEFMCYSTAGEPAPTLDLIGGDNVPHR